jgi:hypothetical protein
MKDGESLNGRQQLALAMIECINGLNGAIREATVGTLARVDEPEGEGNSEVNKKETCTTPLAAAYASTPANAWLDRILRAK